jgi:transcriptional regulator with XRE-family HTH domain
MPGHNVRKNPQPGLFVTDPSALALLKQARTRFTQREIAAHVGKDIKTVRRWEKGDTPCPAMLEAALRDLLRAGTAAAGRPQAQVQEGDPAFRFIDLFAGIGGIRMGFEAQGGTCVFTSEWNDFSKKTMANITRSSATSSPFRSATCPRTTCCSAASRASRSRSPA